MDKPYTSVGAIIGNNTTMTFLDIVENDVNPYYLMIGIVTPFLQIKFYLKTI